MEERTLGFMANAVAIRPVKARELGIEIIAMDEDEG